MKKLASQTQTQKHKKGAGDAEMRRCSIMKEGKDLKQRSCSYYTSCGDIFDSLPTSKLP